MATTTLRPVPHFPDESPSLRSFTPLPPPTRASLETSSMKSRKSFLDILGSARRVVAAGPSPSSGSKLKREAKLAEEDTGAASTSGAINRAAQNGPTPAKQKTEVAEPASSPSQRARSKSRTILRVISTTFRSRSPISPTSPPATNSDLQAKQNREAALRERGLLPPLKPNKDLSRQEAEQDRRIPIVPAEPVPAESNAAPSAADLIKRAWEAKHMTEEDVEVDERDRMNSFRFGGSSAKPPGPAELKTVNEVNTPQPSPTIDGVAGPLPIPARDLPRKASSHRSSDSAERNIPDPCTVPLPSSPLPTPPPTPSRAVGRLSASIVSATSPPPTSFYLPRHADADSSSTSSARNRTGSNPRRSTSSSTQPPTPAISLTPPFYVNSSGESSVPTASAPHRRSGSLSQMPSISESVSSVMTPSLGPSSYTATTVSTLTTAESSGALAAAMTSASGPKGKNNMLQVKTNEHARNIPMIIESPVEDNLIPGFSAGEIGTIPEEVPLPLSPLSEAHSSSSLAVPQMTLAPVRRGRGFTNPEKGDPKPDKRKSFNPFKRGQSLGPSSEPETKGRSGPSSLRRISVSASLTNLRRAANSLTRPKSAYDAGPSATPRSSTSNGRMFDASHLPPSPTLPSQFTGWTPGTSIRSEGDTTGVGLRPPRRPIDPTLYSRGSILMEASAIQDDEVRRMTELAFLG